jgi:hypothetical protein
MYTTVGWLVTFCSLGILSLVGRGLQIFIKTSSQKEMLNDLCIKKEDSKKNAENMLRHREKFSRWATWRPGFVQIPARVIIGYLCVCSYSHCHGDAVKRI